MTLAVPRRTDPDARANERRRYASSGLGDRRPRGGRHDVTRLAIRESLETFWGDDE